MNEQTQADLDLEAHQRVISAILTVVMRRAGPDSGELREVLKGARKIVAAYPASVELVDALEAAFCGRLDA